MHGSSQTAQTPHYSCSCARTAQLAQLRETVKQMLGVRADVKAHVEALQDMRRQLQPDAEPTDFAAALDVATDEALQDRCRKKSLCHGQVRSPVVRSVHVPTASRTCTQGCSGGRMWSNVSDDMWIHRRQQLHCNLTYSTFSLCAPSVHWLLLAAGPTSRRRIAAGI